MATFILSASAVIDGMSYTDARGEPVTMYSVAPFANLASDQIEARTVQEVIAALERFAKSCEGMGKPVECSAYFPRQAARKPRGYDDAKKRGQLARMVNLHLVNAKASAA
jgi:hypothetical protein